LAPLSSRAQGRDPALVFIGFMGAGKTAAAAAVAGRLGEPFVDADEAFAERHGELPADMIERDGEEAFRSAEEGLVRELLAGDRRVISVGGGAIEIPGVREALAEEVCVWCEVTVEEAWERVQAETEARRPLATDREAFTARHHRRRPLYEALATAVLPQGDPELPARAAPFLAALREAPAVRLAWARSASGEYPSFVGRGLLELAILGRAARHGEIGLAGRPFCVTDTAVGALYADALESLAGRVEIPPGEGAKTLAEAERVLRELARRGMTRSDHLVALGGGVVGDVAGFCAATYQRGVPLVQVPTTLVAQVDAAYGGKTGVDLPEAKNYVGAYHLPSAVLADTETLRTLPTEELAAGFAEVLKTALIAGGALWERVRSLDELDPAALDDVIFACARAKLEVVAADERDAGRRAVLNLGHTVGHALEQATGYSRYRHGEAVGLGLLAALRLSGAVELRDEVRALLERHGLPVDIDSAIEVDAVLAAVEHDKKRDGDRVGFVLLERPGALRVGEAVDAGSLRGAVEELRA
jgi:shikimate kinase / 3-dehydroquinate synthase